MLEIFVHIYFGICEVLLGHLYNSDDDVDDDNDDHYDDDEPCACRHISPANDPPLARDLATDPECSD